MDNFEKVKQLISRELGVEEDAIAMDSKLIDDLGADSLSVVELIMAFEDEFNATLEDDQLEKIQTVGDIVRALEALQ